MPRNQFPYSVRSTISGYNGDTKYLCFSTVAGSACTRTSVRNPRGWQLTT